MAKDGTSNKAKGNDRIQIFWQRLDAES